MYSVVYVIIRVKEQSILPIEPTGLAQGIRGPAGVRGAQKVEL